LLSCIIYIVGGCYVEGNWLRNAFRWKETVGPWEERPGHLGDVWNSWSDDGLGYLEYLQVCMTIKIYVMRIYTYIKIKMKLCKKHKFD